MRLEIPFNICRICLQNTNDDMSSIYEAIIGKNGVCGEMRYQRIERCGGIEVLTNPELPNKICKRCNIFLNIAHKFRTMCKSSDEYLRDFVCQTTGYSEDPHFKKHVDGDNGKAEYLLEYIPDKCNSTVANGRHQTENDVDISQMVFNYDEDNEYYDVIDNENEPQQNITSVSQNKDSLPSQKTQMHLRRSNRTTGKKLNNSSRKTLDICSDGAAVIRMKSNNLLNQDKQFHICEICGNTYNRKYALEAHMRRHRNEKPFECEICQKAFHLNFQLTRHIRKHTGARPYSCQFCKRSFADRSTMVKHERIHRNERPYRCETCGKTFTYSNVLKVHMLTHTGEKAFICGICNKRFARGHHLRAHLETLLHQSDPRAKVLLKKIKREEESFGDDY